MAGAPHYKTSRTSTSNYEPLYPAHFQIILTPPPSIAGWDLVIENVKAVGGLGGTNLYPEIQTQKYKGTTRSFAGGAVQETAIDLLIDFEVNLDDSNSAFVYKALRQWTDLIYDPLTGRQGLKKDYIGGPMVISWFNKQGDIHQQWKFPTVFPSAALPGIDKLDYSDQGIFAIDGFSLRADYWDETIL